MWMIQGFVGVRVFPLPWVFVSTACIRGLIVLSGLQKALSRPSSVLLGERAPFGPFVIGLSWVWSEGSRWGVVSARNPHKVNVVSHRAGGGADDVCQDLCLKTGSITYIAPHAP